MTGQRLDTEQVIRDWLADSAPRQAPASLKAALEEATSRPAGQVRLGPRVGRHTLLLATRIAAAAAILAIAASGIYLYNSNRAISSAGWPSDSALPSASPAASSPAASPPGSASPAPSTSPGGTSWRLVDGTFDGTFPKLKADFVWNQNPVFALSSGGFLAFMPDGSAATRGSQSGGHALAALRSAGPSVAPASWVTRVFRSGDGTAWNEKSNLPTGDATVSAVTETGGLTVAVGWVGDAPDTAMAWTTSDMQTWHVTELPAPADTRAYGIAVGPAGFLAWGDAPTSTEFWISADGVAWRSLATSGLPETVDELYAIPGGYAIRGFLSDRAAVWRSNDGQHWTRTWTGPGPSGMEYYALGPIAKATDGRYVSFGVAGVGTGGGSTVPFDLLVWTSSDLTSWTKSARVPAPGWMNGFAAVPGGFVAAGAQPAAGDAGVVSWGPLSVWTSQDGTTWQPLAGLTPTGPIEVLSVVGDGTHAVVTFLDKDGNVRMLVGSGLQ